MKDLFGFEMISQNKFTTAQIDKNTWTKEMLDLLMEFIENDDRAADYRGLDWSQEYDYAINFWAGWNFTKEEFQNVKLRQAFAYAIDRQETLELVEIDVRRCWETLGEISGETASEDIIDRVFERFCLGK